MNIRHSTAVLLSHSLLSFLGLGRFYLNKNILGVLRFLLTLATGILLAVLFGGIIRSEGLRVGLILVTALCAIGNLIWYYADLFRLCYAEETDADDLPLSGSQDRDKAVFLWLFLSTGGMGIHQFYLRNTIRGMAEFTLFYLSMLFVGLSAYFGSADMKMILAILAGVFAFSLFVMLIVDILQFLHRSLPIPAPLDFQSDRPKSRVNALLLNLWGGYLGLDRYYLGYKTIALLKFFTFGGFLIWNIMDAIFLYSGSLKDAEGKELV